MGVLDTARTLTAALTLIAPEESPVILVSSELRTVQSTRVGLASAVRRTLHVVVLVVGLEDGEGLRLRGARVVAALGRLDGVAALRSAAGWRGWVGAFGIGGGGVEGCGC